MTDFSEKVAFITGAAGGLGSAQVKAFAEAGARVIAADIRDDEGKRVVDAIAGTALFVHLDVSSEASWAAAVKSAVDEFGRIDVLVNNAAIHHAANIEDEDPEAFRTLINTNLTGTFLGIRAVIPTMRAQASGAIINLASVAGNVGIEGHAAYGGAKWAIRGISRTAALELGRYGIRVNTILPGPIDTAMLGDGDTAAIAPSIPLARVGQPEEVAAVAMFIASDAAGYMTGSEILLDGGLTAGMITPK